MIKTKTKRQLNQRRILPANYFKEVTFLEHLLELRKRIIYVAISILVGSTAAYFIQQHIVNLLLKPSHGQRFIYTSPGGGINFLFDVCIYVGVALSVPVIIYQVLRFIEPVIRPKSWFTMLRFSIFSGVLGLIGVLFGYFAGLPVALKFLSNQFTTSQITPLFTIQEYLSFVAFYLFASSLIFQLPLLIFFTNRIKPISPKKLLKFDRYVIVAAFIISGLMAPTINIFSQLIIAGPVIIIYQLTIVGIWLVNRNRFPRYNERIKELMQFDQEVKQYRNSIRKSPLFTDIKIQFYHAPHGQDMTAYSVSTIKSNKLPLDSIKNPASRPNSLNHPQLLTNMSTRTFKSTRNSAYGQSTY